MLRSSITCLLLSILALTVALAADFNGRWEGAPKLPNGDEIKLFFNFKVEGEKLTGTFETPNGDVPLTDCKVKDDQIWFTVTLGDTKITHEGKIAGENINMKSHGPWGDSEFVLKRSPKK
jgi:hypothetical protein